LTTNTNTSVHQLELKWRPLHDLIYSMDLAYEPAADLMTTPRAGFECLETAVMSDMVPTLILSMWQ